MRNQLRYILFNKHTWTCNLKCFIYGLAPMGLVLIIVGSINYLAGYPLFGGESPVEGAMLTLGVIYASLVSGIWPGLISTAIVYYLIQDFDMVRIENIMVLCLGAVIGISWGRWKRMGFDSLNGNIERLRVASAITRDLMVNWNNYQDDFRRTKVGEVEEVLGNLITLIAGWLTIGQEVEKIKKQVGQDE